MKGEKKGGRRNDEAVGEESGLSKKNLLRKSEPYKHVVWVYNLKNQKLLKS